MFIFFTFFHFYFISPFHVDRRIKRGVYLGITSSKFSMTPKGSKQIVCFPTCLYKPYFSLYLFRASSRNCSVTFKCSANSKRFLIPALCASINLSIGNSKLYPYSRARNSCFLFLSFLIEYISVNSKVMTKFFYVLNTTKERENKLNEQIDAQNDVLAKFSEKCDVVIEKLDRIERNQK